MEAGGELRSTRGETQVWEVICLKPAFLYFLCPLVAAKWSPVSSARVCSRSQHTRMATPASQCSPARTASPALTGSTPSPLHSAHPLLCCSAFWVSGCSGSLLGLPTDPHLPVWIVPVPSPTLLFSRPFRMLEAGVGRACHTWLCSGIAPVSVLRSGTCSLGVICHSGDEIVSGLEQGQMQGKCSSLLRWLRDPALVSVEGCSIQHGLRLALPHPSQGCGLFSRSWAGPRGPPPPGRLLQGACGSALPCSALPCSALPCPALPAPFFQFLLTSFAGIFFTAENDGFVYLCCFYFFWFLSPFLFLFWNFLDIPGQIE